MLIYTLQTGDTYRSSEKTVTFFQTTFSVKNSKPLRKAVKYAPFPTRRLNQQAFIMDLPSSFLLNFPSGLSRNTR
ncbi:hypothetical protein NEIMUCOT_04232 [Neisseria mucosa ATCC 25996]|uniref:Uncharacterized protein n=1 Tax=Neisseria mucosa (strain ATCC 25996 / DSM 4631 / NCTC 10774 / M26) TaxID=546266 RepID=D2ZUE4_NEIM2|nr:hypothetical protein NEIMUCOT_04232 [Neisseria mucosa ATCC 25996]